MTRREIREQALSFVFELGFQDRPLEEMLEDAASCRDEAVDGYAREILEKYLDHRDTVEESISRFSRKWKISRLSKVSLAVLKIAVTELLYCPETPDGAVINEAVELGKKYATEEDAAYVNGVLGGFVRSGMTGASPSSV